MLDIKVWGHSRRRWDRTWFQKFHHFQCAFGRCIFRTFEKSSPLSDSFVLVICSIFVRYISNKCAFHIHSPGEIVKFQLRKQVYFRKNILLELLIFCRKLIELKNNKLKEAWTANWETYEIDIHYSRDFTCSAFRHKFEFVSDPKLNSFTAFKYWTRRSLRDHGFTKFIIHVFTKGPQSQVVHNQRNLSD